MSDDIRALDEACDALWGDPDDQPRPSPERVGARAIVMMYREQTTFAEACRLLASRELEARDLEARAKALRG